jgi:hypothetical protein
MVKNGIYMRTVESLLTDEPQTVEELTPKAGYMPNIRYLDMTLLRLLDLGRAEQIEPGKWIKPRATTENPTKE